MPGPRPNPHRLRFGVFELDPEGGELRRRGVRVHLQNQPAKVLACLATRAGDVVSREELKREVWADSTFVDFDRGLNFCINRVRRVLGDDAAAPLYIETVPRRGYRFVAPVSADGPPPDERASWRGSPTAAGVLLMAAALFQQGTPPPVAPVLKGKERSVEEVVPAARAAYLRGAYHAVRESGQVESLAALLDAVRLDPGFAAAHSALAAGYVRQVEMGLLLPREGMPRARAAAARALALSDDPAASVAMGSVALRYDWDFPSAERSLRRALDGDPRSIRGHVEYADLLLVQGRVDEAIQMARRAEELDPVCTLVRGRLANSLYAARRFDEAAEAWGRAVAVDPSLVGLHERRFHAYRHASRPREALLEASQVASLLGRPGAAARLLEAPTAPSLAAFMRGTIDHLGQDARAPGLFSDRIAVLHAALGERDLAFRWLRVAARERTGDLPVTLRTDPDLDPLRDDPRFRALLAELSLS